MGNKHRQQGARSIGSEEWVAGRVVDKESGQRAARRVGSEEQIIQSFYR